MACKISVEKSADIVMAAGLCATNWFSLATSKILSLSLTFRSLFMMCLYVGFLGFLLFGTLHFLDVHFYFIFEVREFFGRYFLKQVFNPLLSLFYWCPYKANIGMVDAI